MIYSRFPGLEQIKRNATLKQLPKLSQRFKVATEKLVEFNGTGALPRYLFYLPAHAFQVHAQFVTPL